MCNEPLSNNEIEFELHPGMDDPELEMQLGIPSNCNGNRRINMLLHRNMAGNNYVDASKKLIKNATLESKGKTCIGGHDISKSEKEEDIPNLSLWEKWAEQYEFDYDFKDESPELCNADHSAKGEMLQLRLVLREPGLEVTKAQTPTREIQNLVQIKKKDEIAIKPETKVKEIKSENGLPERPLRRVLLNNDGTPTERPYRRVLLRTPTMCTTTVSTTLVNAESSELRVETTKKVRKRGKRGGGKQKQNNLKNMQRSSKNSFSEFQYKRKGVISTKLHITVAICLITFLLTGVEADKNVRTFNMCGASKSGYALEVPAKIHCEPPEAADVTLTTVVDVYVPRSKPTKIIAYKCHIRKRTICTHTSFFGGRGIVLDKSETEVIDSNECRATVQNKQWKDTKLVSLQSGLWTTNNTLGIQYEWCCKDKCKTVSNLIIEVGQMATIDGHTFASDLGDVGGCHPGAGRCTLADGVLIWAPQNFANFCKYKFLGTYDAEINLAHVVINTLQSALTISVPFTGCNFQSSYLTEQGVVLKLRTLAEVTAFNSQWLNDTDNKQLVSNMLQSILTESDKFVIDEKPSFVEKRKLLRQNLTTTSSILTTGRPTTVIISSTVKEYDPVNVKLNYLLDKVT